LGRYHDKNQKDIPKQVGEQQGSGSLANLTQINAWFPFDVKKKKKSRHDKEQWYCGARDTLGNQVSHKFIQCTCFVKANGTACNTNGIGISMNEHNSDNQWKSRHCKS
jgi:hypothetical protein